MAEKEKDDGIIRSSDFGTTERMLIIPQESENREFLLSVDRAGKEMMRQKFVLFYEYDWEVNTVATCTLTMLINILRLDLLGQMSDILEVLSVDDDNNKYIDFFGLLKIYPTTLIDRKMEKIGCINCKFIPGDRISNIISDNSTRELSHENIERAKVSEYYLTGDEKKDKAWDKFDSLVRTELTNTYSIMIPQHFAAIATTECFLECLYRALVMKLAASNGEEPAVSTNVNDYCEIYAISVENPDGSLGVSFTITPGMYSKQGIKEDSKTEIED